MAAGINDFQPYVVAGEIEPPAPAVLEPQFCLRFNDIDNVGITGRHYTGFIMVGQHTFNTPEKHVYFKEEGIAQIHEFLTKGLGIPADEIVFHEDVWAGGGNFGPSIEYFSSGLELGNQVYMQYEQLPDEGFRELRTKVIDMGAGPGAMGVVQPGPADVLRRSVPEDHGVPLQQDRLQAGPGVPERVREVRGHPERGRDRGRALRLERHREADMGMSLDELQGEGL